MDRISVSDIEDMLARQLTTWEVAERNYAALSSLSEKTCDVDGMEIRVVCNTGRVRSTAAAVSATDISGRPCFLCGKNRPPEQLQLPWRGYSVLVNPYPIFPRHFTVVAAGHEVQKLHGRLADMLDLARMLPGYVVFYNGPHSGASAPDHMHFQIGNLDFLPLERNIQHNGLTAVAESGTARMSTVNSDVMSMTVIDGDSNEDMAVLFDSMMLPVAAGDEEPDYNVLCYSRDSGRLRLVVMPRRCHRPDCYYAGDPLLISPGAADMAGVVTTVRAGDFGRTDSDVLRDVFRQVSRRAVPMVSVGIMSAHEVDVNELSLSGDAVSRHRYGVADGMVTDNGKPTGRKDILLPGLGRLFEIADVTIGVGFHWQRRETQRFAGSVKLIVTGDDVTVINIIDVEEYLRSVISSEMSATASLELLKAHAVISRSWLLSQIARRDKKSCRPAAAGHDVCGDEVIRWYDREDHGLFDVCADDHCQRYQGVTRQTTARVADAVAATRGEVLRYGGELCDARFSKCCGGVMEQFENCWEDTPKPYLAARRDSADETDFPDLTVEEVARRWIGGRPDAFCASADGRVLSQVLNNYDRETVDFYRWTVSYTDRELSELVGRRSGIDFGMITDIQPLARGTSGRIFRLRIVGTKRTVTVGKELEIRRWLSDSHLYSSAFTVDKRMDASGCTRFVLTGAGWGHGVGLCQIGAAVMGDRGYGYRDILTHYYPDADVTAEY